jgi:hypothetical protein
MEGLNSTTSVYQSELICSQESHYNDIISTAECKKFFGENLPDEKATEIKNNLVGIVNSVINFYLEGFK